MEIRCVIIDDEPNNIENLQHMLATWCEGIKVIGSAVNAAAGEAMVKAKHPDLVFLDIQMPGGSGFDMLRNFGSISFEVIFVTAFDQYGIQAIKFSALDYLLKPIDVKELQHAVAKAKQRLAAKKQNERIDNLLHYIKLPQKEMPRIALPTLHETRYVKVNTIIRCEASDNYTHFFLATGETILVCKTLKEFSELLSPYGFQRTHQSHLVNLAFVKSWLKENGGMLLLEDQSRIPVSRQNHDNVKKALTNL